MPKQPEAKPLPVIIQVTNPDVPAKRGSIIVLDVVDEEAAMEIAKKIAAATGCSVRVSDVDMIEIQTIPAATKQ
jgi:hypothetical protein